MSQSILQRYCDNAIGILNSQYLTTRVLQHNATAGAAREQLIKDFLTNHLPELIRVVSGQIVDAQGNYSKQQDIVLALKSMPRLPFASGHDLVYQEGVVATVEIKTSLNATVFGSIGENIASVNALSGGNTVTSAMSVAHNWPIARILNAVVTYGGSTFSSLTPALEQLQPSAQPDLVLDLSQGLLVRNHGLLLPITHTVGQSKPLLYTEILSPAEGFKMFLTFLTEITGTLAARGVQWRAYW